MANHRARTPLMAGNWKMNLNHLEAIAHIQKLAFALNDKDYAAVEVAVLPPFTDLRSVQTLVDGDKLKIRYGAQDLSAHDSGAYTGEISGPMLAKLGCTYVVVGHSERRQYHGEDEADGQRQGARRPTGTASPRSCAWARAWRSARRATRSRTPSRRSTGPSRTSRPSRPPTLVIAYEPVWAIGTGEVATPEDAQEVCGAIRSRLGASSTRQEAGRRGPHPVRRLGQGVATSPRSWRSPTSTARWSAVPSLDAEEFAKIVRFGEQAVG